MLEMGAHYVPEAWPVSQCKERTAERGTQRKGCRGAWPLTHLGVGEGQVVLALDHRGNLCIRDRNPESRRGSWSEERC